MAAANERTVSNQGMETLGDVEAAVIGAGPAGLAASIALAASNISTALIAPPHRPDNRTTALLAGSVVALETLDVWPSGQQQAAPIEGIRIVDDCVGLFRAPEILFRADEIGLPAFGYNIPNRALVAALERRAAGMRHLRRIEMAAEVLEPDEAGVTIRLSDGGDLRAQLVVGADGRNSRSRHAASIAAQAEPYPQSAVTANFSHTRPHLGISTEFHTRGGPFTLVPLSGEQSSLVWVTETRHAEELYRLNEEDFVLAAERQSHSMLGKMKLISERSIFPLSWLSARRLAADRVILVGEAAHVVPPIGAQGFNLGLRDAATAAELAAEAHRAGNDIGAPEVMTAYEQRRRLDVQSRTAAVDLLNRSLLSDFLPLQALRGLGLQLLGQIEPLRRLLMQEGVRPRFGEPRLMRGYLP